MPAVKDNDELFGDSSDDDDENEENDNDESPERGKSEERKGAKKAGGAAKGNDDEELFGDSSDEDDDEDDGDGDDDDNAAKATTTPSKRKLQKKSNLLKNKKKKGGRLQKKGKGLLKKKKPSGRKSTSLADGLSEGSDNDDDTEEDDEESPPKKKAKSLAGGKAKSRKEKMDALAAKKRVGSSSSSKVDKKNKSVKDDKGYDSGDSYNSGEFVQTKADMEFIDNDGDDEEMLAEYNKKQHFDDEPPDSEDEVHEDDIEDSRRSKKSKSKSKTYKSKTGDSVGELLAGVTEENPPENPILEAVWRMRKKKKAKPSTTARVEAAEALLNEMNDAATADADVLAKRRPGPATHRLNMLETVLRAMASVEDHKDLLDSGLLSACGTWISPLEKPQSGGGVTYQLGNLTLRRRILEAVSALRHLDTTHLRESGFGRVVFALYKHPHETPDLKKLEKSLIDRWSTFIFSPDEGKDEAKEEDTREPRPVYRPNATSTSTKTTRKDLASILSSSNSTSNRPGSGSALGNNRVRVPYSKGFNFSKNLKKKKNENVEFNPTQNRSNFQKKLFQKKSSGSKIKRSVQMSADGKGI